MEEILYELREHSAGLNAGRWDYLFSCIKTFRGPSRRPRVLPDRAQVTMTVPFMRAYTERLVRTCHRRGAHAMGGMAAFIPSRRDAAVNEAAMRQGARRQGARVVATASTAPGSPIPDLVPLATEVFDGVLGGGAEPAGRRRRRGAARAPRCRAIRPPCSTCASTAAGVTEAGVRLNVSVALQYLDRGCAGNGAAAINNLMEDAATAEISRSQLWQWRTTGTPLDDGRPLTADRYRAIRDEELASLGVGCGRSSSGRPSDEAADLLDALVLADEFIEFLTTAGATSELGLTARRPRPARSAASSASTAGPPCPARRSPCSSPTPSRSSACCSSAGA